MAAIEPSGEPYMVRTEPRQGRALLPRALLYSVNARIGGIGLDQVAADTLRTVVEEKILRRAFAYDLRDPDIPAGFVSSLRWSPIRLVSFMASPDYYAAKKRYLDRRVAAHLRKSAQYDCFHSWSGDALSSLREAKRQGLPALLEIPTWHRHKGKNISGGQPTSTPPSRPPLRERIKERFQVSREQILEEYQLADVLLVQSRKSAETFLAEGFPREKLFWLPRAVDIERFKPGASPPLFRAIFAGALIRRKGVHQLLEAWSRLNLKDAELILFGTVHEEIQPYLERFRHPSIKVAGFAHDLPEQMAKSSLHIFPSTCEGTAKVTMQAAASGLPQIATREAGDMVIDGENGFLVPCDDVDALEQAIRRAYNSPDLMKKMGEAARRRVEENFTPQHFHRRLLAAYEWAAQRVGKGAPSK